MKNSHGLVKVAFLAASVAASVMMMSCSNNAMKTSMNPAEATVAGIPATPSNLKAVATDYTNVLLTWNYSGNTSDVGGYMVEMDDGSGMWERVAILSNIATSTYITSDYVQGFTYNFRVSCAGIGSGGSGYSNVASAEIPNETIGAATNVVATATARGTLKISWTNNCSFAQGFYVERAPTGSAQGHIFTQIATVNYPATSYSNTGLTDNTIYDYRIRTFGRGGFSLYSDAASGLTTSNIGLGVSASAATSQSANPAKNGNDGSTTTRWCASSSSMTSQWYKVDLGSTKSITDVEIMFEKAGVGSDCNDFTIETSTNNSTWTTKVNKATNTTTAQTQKYNFAATSARYVRITIKDAPGTAWASLYEFRVFGK